MGKQVQISSKKDIDTFIKKELSENYLNTNVYEITRELFLKNEGASSFMPSKREIQSKNKIVKDATKLGDLEILRHHKNRREEKWCRKVVIIGKYTYGIFASDAMINRLKCKGTQSKVKRIDIDGSFKVPRPFTQLLTNYIYEENSELFGPVFFVLTNSKESLSYENIYLEIDSILSQISEDTSNLYKYDADIWISDFELGQINTLIKRKPQSIKKGCYFHFLQCLWENTRKIGLKVKEMIHIMREIITALSLLCFLRRSNIESCFNVIKKHYNEIYNNEKIIQFFSYFENTWIKGNFPTYLWNYFEDELGIQFKNIQRTNNCVESFHNQLSLLLNRVSITNVKITILIAENSNNVTILRSFK